MPTPHEIELKLEFDPGDLGCVSRRIGAFAGVPRDPAARLKATYFDTRDKALRRRGLSLRIRTKDAETRQTLKSGRDGLFDRRQWECPVDAERPDLRLFKKKPRKLIAGRDLEPVFITDIQRTTWQIGHGVSKIEIALDDGEVRSAQAAGRVTEVELELLTGTRADLFDVAQLLSNDVALRVGVRSKSERGYMLEQPADKAAKAEAIELDPAMTAGTAFQAVARSCLRQYRLNEAALLATRDADALHQARVAIRRLRSALSIFRKVVADDRVEEIKRRLKEVAVTLGAARNLDVYGKNVPATHEDGDEAGLMAYRARIGVARDAAYARVLRALETQDFRLFVLDLTRWIESGPWLTGVGNVKARERSIEKFASAEIHRRTRSVVKRGKNLETLDVETRHRVRIAAKKLRYANEFFASLKSGKKARRRHRAFIRKLEVLQDALGAVNDIHTGRDVARDIVDAVPPAAAAFATGHSTHEQDAQERRLIGEAAKAFAKFEHAAA